MTIRVLEGHALSMLRTLSDNSVHACVTSPPYWALRAYGTDPEVWGGTEGCDHEWGDEMRGWAMRGPVHEGMQGGTADREGYLPSAMPHGAFCVRCSAWLGELGHEPMPALFVAHLVELFREVRRVLRPDATLWVNLGDSYAGSGKGPTGHNGIGDQAIRQGFANDRRAGRGLRSGEGYELRDQGAVTGCKRKDLVLIPERFAIAMQADGWYVRSRIAWCKKSAMPESVRDRPTSAWEHVWLFAKSASYFYDAVAVRQPTSPNTHARVASAPGSLPAATPKQVKGRDDRIRANDSFHAATSGQVDGANLRNYWLLGPEPLKEAHYAAFVSEIPKRAILAGTSERGACPACGAPWVRSTATQGKTSARARNVGGRADNFALPAQWKGGQPPTTRVTVGWQAGCACDAGEPVPCVVLDPFLGSGTTAIAADRLGRDAIGIELNPEYVGMARRRVAGDAPMFTEVD